MEKESGDNFCLLFFLLLSSHLQKSPRNFLSPNFSSFENSTRGKMKWLISVSNVSYLAGTVLQMYLACYVRIRRSVLPGVTFRGGG